MVAARSSVRVNVAIEAGIAEIAVIVATGSRAATGSSNKDRSKGRIDPLVAAVMAVGHAARMPAPTVRRLNEELNAVLASPDARALLAREGADPRPSTPSNFRNLIHSDIVRWGQLAKQANIQID